MDRKYDISKLDLRGTFGCVDAPATRLLEDLLIENPEYQQGVFSVIRKFSERLKDLSYLPRYGEFYRNLTLSETIKNLNNYEGDYIFPDRIKSCLLNVLSTMVKSRNRKEAGIENDKRRSL